MNTEQAGKLREPFPPELIGQLPRGGTMLDYVGHAAVTDRLLQVDPEWTWKPMAVDAMGAPVLIQGAGAQGEPLGIWIFLTVCGVTRPGFGGGRNAKECISDALRNAAMRFGVGLDLWSKADLHADNNGGAVDRPVTGGTAGAETPTADRAPAGQQRLAELRDLIVQGAEAHGKKPADVTKQILFSYGKAALDELTGVEVIDASRKLRTWLGHAEETAA